MLFPRIVICTVAFALPLSGPVSSLAAPEAAPAQTELVANYQVGMRLKAKNACTVKGFAIKQGVILTVTAVHTDGAGKPRALDLSFSGMTIADVDVETINKHFRPA